MESIIQTSAQGLAEQLKQATIRDRDLDVEIASEWAAVDTESWQHMDQRNGRKVAGRIVVKSTSRPLTRR